MTLGATGTGDRPGGTDPGDAPALTRNRTTNARVARTNAGPP
ncbi:hypothetical protein [Candidatus Halobonum tyrrellensis]|nr:hypothetical protein [Candidatus Halobonum tyrrellensis]